MKNLYRTHYSGNTKQFFAYNFSEGCIVVLLHRNGNGTGTVNGTGTHLGNNRSWSLSLSQTSVNIFTAYYTFHLVDVQVLVPFPCSVTKPLHLLVVSLSVKKNSQFDAVFRKIWQNHMSAPPGGLAPPPTGNPGSTSDFRVVMKTVIIS